jgi:DNA-binding NtrC family response regulator
MSHSTPREVLVVEDEPLVRIVAADSIVESGVMAWEAGDAREALKVLAEHPRIGLIFIDVNMPGEMDGLELAKKVNSDRPEMALIVTSGHVRVPDCKIPDHGTFLPKPYHTGRLVDLVREKLDGRGR